jgi:predicted transcriptional regulator
MAKTEIETGTDVDLVSDERYNYDVVEWIDREGNHGFEVLNYGSGDDFAKQLQDKAKRILIYTAQDDQGSSTDEVAAYVRDNPQLEA